MVDTSSNFDATSPSNTNLNATPNSIEDIVSSLKNIEAASQSQSGLPQSPLPNFEDETEPALRLPTSQESLPEAPAPSGNLPLPKQGIRTAFFLVFCAIFLLAASSIAYTLEISEVDLGIVEFASKFLAVALSLLGINKLLSDELFTEKLHNWVLSNVGLTTYGFICIVVGIAATQLPKVLDASDSKPPSAILPTLMTLPQISSITATALPLGQSTTSALVTLSPEMLSPSIEMPPTNIVDLAPTLDSVGTLPPTQSASGGLTPTNIAPKTVVVPPIAPSPAFCFLRVRKDGTRLRRIPDTTPVDSIIKMVESGTWLQAFSKIKAYTDEKNYEEWYKVQVPGEDRQGYVHETLVEALNCDDITYESEYRIFTDHLLPVTVLPVQKTVVARLPEPTYTSEPVQNVISTPIRMITSSPTPTVKLTEDATLPILTATPTPTITPSPTVTVDTLSGGNVGLPTQEVDGSPVFTATSDAQQTGGNVSIPTEEVSIDTTTPTGTAEATDERALPTEEVIEVTLTPTNTETATLIPTLTPTDTPTLTPSETPTASHTPTATLTPSKTPTLTATAMPTPSLRIEIVPPQTAGSLAYGARVYLETGDSSQLLISDLVVVFRLVDMNSVEQHRVEERYSLYCLWQGDPACQEPSANMITKLNNQRLTLYIQAYWNGLTATLTTDFPDFLEDN